MIKIIDTFDQVRSLLSGASFDLEKWKNYINSIYEDSSQFFLDDMQEMISGDYTFEKDFLPVILAVHDHPRLSELHRSFQTVTDRLNERVLNTFGRELDIEIVLYLGLCNGAGWVTALNGKNVILLGMEKILELDWEDLDSMYGLIYHELGHVYHKQYGKFEGPVNEKGAPFIWQLFTEGIAMAFEQTLVGSPDYYHQDKNGWKDWCKSNFATILSDFRSDLPTMTRTTQRYFGDWVSYQGYGDVGYYLGGRWIRFLLENHALAELVTWEYPRIEEAFLAFTRAQL